MEKNEEQKKPCLLKRAWACVKKVLKSSWRWLIPDKDETRIKYIEDWYSVVPKDGDLYLVYNNQVVIKKLPPCYQNLDTITIIKDTATAQLEYEGLIQRP